MFILKDINIVHFIRYKYYGTLYHQIPFNEITSWSGERNSATAQSKLSFTPSKGRIKISVVTPRINFAYICHLSELNKLPIWLQ